MPSKLPKLRLDWVDGEAARFACKRWHYTRTMPVAPVKIGIWEDEKFAGVILFGVGSGRATHGGRFGLKKHHDIAELCRIAMAPWHQTPVSRCLAIATRMLKKQSPNLRMLISFADIAQGHHGGIYQANGWLYLGVTESDLAFIVNGKRKHNKTIRIAVANTRRDRPLAERRKPAIDWLHEHIDPNARRVELPGKHRYVLPLDDEMRSRLLPMVLPYPKREKVLVDA